MTEYIYTLFVTVVQIFIIYKEEHVVHKSISKCVLVIFILMVVVSISIIFKWEKDHSKQFVAICSVLEVLFEGTR